MNYYLTITGTGEPPTSVVLNYQKTNTVKKGWNAQDKKGDRLVSIGILLISVALPVTILLSLSALGLKDRVKFLFDHRALMCVIFLSIPVAMGFVGVCLGFYGAYLQDEAKTHLRKKRSST